MVEKLCHNKIKVFRKAKTKGDETKYQLPDTMLKVSLEFILPCEGSLKVEETAAGREPARSAVSKKTGSTWVSQNGNKTKKN